MRETNVKLHYKHVEAASFSKANKQTKKQTMKKKQTVTFPDRTSKIKLMLFLILFLTFLTPAIT